MAMGARDMSLTHNEIWRSESCNLIGGTLVRQEPRASVALASALHGAAWYCSTSPLNDCWAA